MGLAAVTPSASWPLVRPSKYIARSATTSLPGVSDSITVENSATCNCVCSPAGKKVTREFGSAVICDWNCCPVAVRYVARTCVGVAFGLATRT